MELEKVAPDVGREQLIDGRADQGAPDRPHPAHDAGDDHLQRVLDLEEVVGRDMDVLVGDDAAGARREDRREGEGHHLEHRRVDPEHPCGVLVFPDRDPAIAELGAREADRDRDPRDDQSEGRVIEEGAVAADGQVDPGGPFRDLVPGAGDLPEGLGHAERRDREVMPLQAKHGNPHERGHDRREQRAREERREERQMPLRQHQESRRVGADSEEGDVAERRVPRIAADEVPPLRHQSQAQDVRIRQQLVGGHVSRQEEEPGKRDREEDEPNRFHVEQASEKGCEAALRAPRGRMQGGATRAMPLRIGEERRRRRRPRAAATACGGWPFAPDSVPAKRYLSKQASLCTSCKRPDTTPASIFQQPANWTLV